MQRIARRFARKHDVGTFLGEAERFAEKCFSDECVSPCGSMSIFHPKPRDASRGFFLFSDN